MYNIPVEEYDRVVDVIVSEERLSFVKQTKRSELKCKEIAAV